MGVILKNSKILLVLVVLAAAYFAWNNPDSVPYPPLKDKINQLKNNEINIEQLNSITSETPGFVLGITDKIKTFSQNTTIPTEISGLPEEVVVEDIVNNLTDEVKKLPEQQAKKIKTQFCQDIIDEATTSAQ